MHVSDATLMMVDVNDLKCYNLSHYFAADVKSINASEAVDVKAGEPMDFGCALPAGDEPPYPPVQIVYTIDGKVSYGYSFS